MYASLTRAGQKIVASDIDNTADDNPHNAIYDHDDADRDVDGQTVFLGDHDVMVSDMAGFSAIDQSRDVFAHGQDESVELPKSPRGACDIENTLLATSGGPEGRDMSPPESGILHSSAASGDLGGLVTASNTPSFSGSGQSVVIIDTGNGAYYNAHNVIFDHDFAHDDTDGRDPALFSHGAMVGDVVSDNAAGAGIIHLKVTSGFNRFARMEDIEAALDWVIENAETFNVAAVNVSMGFGDVNHEVATALSDEFQILKSEGVVTVVAAGNGGLQNNVEGINVLAANSNVIAVGAATNRHFFRRTRGSSYPLRSGRRWREPLRRHISIPAGRAAAASVAPHPELPRQRRRGARALRPLARAWHGAEKSGVQAGWSSGPLRWAARSCAKGRQS